MSAIVLLVALFFTTLLTDMPKAVLGAIVFLIGIDLIDITGLRRIARRRWSEFVIAVVTGVVVCAVGMEQGIILAIALSIIEVIRRQYTPRDFVLGVSDGGPPAYEPATPGAQSAYGLIVFRYDAELFYANANRFVDDIERLVDKAPDKVRWLILDAAGLDDIDYSAGPADRRPGRLAVHEFGRASTPGTSCPTMFWSARTRDIARPSGRTTVREPAARRES
jgi:MFS superfamily sulfate permease-like transporter